MTGSTKLRGQINRTLQSRARDGAPTRLRIIGGINLAEYFLPMAEAFRRFMPEVIDIANRTMTHSRADKAGVIEGDLRIDREGLVLTSELVPAFKGATLGAIFVTGSLLAPDATLAEPDIDWSPLLKVKGNVIAKKSLPGRQRVRDRRRRDGRRRPDGLLSPGADANSRQDARAAGARVRL
jgi:hypothetical protein